MSFLNQVSTGVLEKNKLILMYGPEGVGKSSFGASTDKPIFLGTEGGTENLNIARLPKPNNWDEVLKMIHELTASDHAYKTLVIDTLDWLEPIMFDHLTKGSKPIEEVGGGYGKWVGIVNQEWRTFMSLLDKLRKKMDVVILAHSHLKTFNDPINNVPYDRYELKLHSPKSSLLWKEYVDCLLFVNFEVVTKSQGEGKKAHAYGSGERKVYSERRPSFDAKNRDHLPFEMPLDVKAIYLAMGNNAINLKKKINERVLLIDDMEQREKIEKFVLSCGDDLAKLSAVSDRIEKILAPTLNV